MDAVRSNLLSINRNVNLNRVAVGLEHVEVVEINGQSTNICDTSQLLNQTGAFTVT